MLKGLLFCTETVQHTSASLTINENYDNDVLDDVETWLNGTVPEVRPVFLVGHYKDFESTICLEV